MYNPCFPSPHLRRILELDRGKGIPFQGNYSGWLEFKANRLASEEKRKATLESQMAKDGVRMTRCAKEPTRRVPSRYFHPFRLHTFLSQVVPLSLKIKPHRDVMQNDCRRVNLRCVRYTFWNPEIQTLNFVLETDSSERGC